MLVALGAHAVRMRLLPFIETLQSGLDKVRGALSLSAQRDLLTTLDQLQFIGVPALSGRPQVRKALEETWFSGAPLTIHYRRKEGSLSVRTVHVETAVMERSITLLNVVDVAFQSLRRREA